jgi:bacterioferritin-associated ferredoxin
VYICVCNGITEREIRARAEEGLRTLAELESCLGVGAGCGRCRHAAKEVLNEARSESRIVASGVPA